MRSRTVTERVMLQVQSPVFSDDLAVERDGCLTKSLPGDCRRRLTRQGCRFWQGLCQSRDVGDPKPPRAIPPFQLQVAQSSSFCPSPSLIRSRSLVITLALPHLIILTLLGLTRYPKSHQ